MCLSKISNLLNSFLFLIALSSSGAYARAGGAGGGSSRSGGSFGGGFSSHSYGHSGGGYVGSGGNSFLVFFIIVIIILYVIYNSKNKISDSSENESSDDNLLYKNNNDDRLDSLENFKKQTPDFNEVEFNSKVKTAFLTIQESWSKEDIGLARRFITDGIYQRYNAQLKMMSALKQHNPLSDIKIYSISLCSAEQDGEYDILNVQIQAGMRDQFICETITSLNSPGGFENFTEYWAFLRKKNHKNKDIFSNEQCPQCSAALPKNMADSGKCHYCGAIVNSGEYDWVVSEITQENDSKNDTKLNEKIVNLRSIDPHFCTQEIEDKASNAFYQLLLAESAQDAGLVKRFLTDDYYQKFNSEISKNASFSYNRLFANSVNLIDVISDDKNINLFIEVNYSFQKVKLLSPQKAEIIDPCLNSLTKILVFNKAREASENKGSIFAKLCSSCGAPIKDSLESKCPYCGNLYNSNKNDWIVCDFLNLRDYYAFKRNDKKSEESFIIREDLMDVKDYVINNLIVMAYADGTFSENEQSYIAKISKSLKFDSDQLTYLIQPSIARNLSLKLPVDLEKRKKIIELMKTIAESDGVVSEREQQILNYVQKYLKE